MQVHLDKGWLVAKRVVDSMWMDEHRYRHLHNSETSQPPVRDQNGAKPHLFQGQRLEFPETEHIDHASLMWNLKPFSAAHAVW